jgi:hypothetical protein
VSFLTQFDEDAGVAFNFLPRNRNVRFGDGQNRAFHPWKWSRNFPLRAHFPDSKSFACAAFPRIFTAANYISAAETCIFGAVRCIYLR